MQIVFLDSGSMNPGDIDFKPLSELGEFISYEQTSPYRVIERSINADIVITNKVKLFENELKQLPNLKMVQLAATGTNNVDLKYTKANKIVVCNVSGYSTPSVAQHVFSLILAYLNQSETYFSETKSKEWCQKPGFSYWHNPILELKDKTFGVYGFGNIGRAVAKIALAFEMKVLTVNKYPERNPVQGVTNVTEEELFKASDFVSLHSSLNDSTFHLIDKTTLSLMKNNAVIINTGRGDLINEEDLKDSLEQNQIGAALLDVLSEEPPQEDHILLTTQNCFITPHQAWASQEARTRLLMGMVTNIKAFQNGEDLLSQVNL